MADHPVIIRTKSAMRALVAEWKAAGEAVGVVPTMGALHEGHIALAARARAESARVIVTIFVNPKQFNNPDDLAKYPRTEEADAALLAPVGVDAIFVPDGDQVYPKDFGTTIRIEGPALPLEGAMRPGHFDGVATVVAKLFGMTQPDRAYFGEKDWQQLQVVSQLVRDLDMAVDIIPCPTLRAHDGLALSSRNRRLSDAGRAKAPALYRALCDAAARIRAGGDADAAIEAARNAVIAAGFDRVEYLELCDAATLQPSRSHNHPLRILAAAWLEDVRLIDNVAA